MKILNIDLVEGFHETLLLVLGQNPAEHEIESVLRDYARTVKVDEADLRESYIMYATLLRGLRTNPEFFNELMLSLGIEGIEPDPSDVN
jgi:hypothetical protein